MHHCHVLPTDANTGRRLYERDYNWICGQLYQYASKWRTIGQGLGFTSAELDTIQASPANFTDAPTSYLYAMFSRWLQWAPGDARGSRDYATLRSLRRAVDRAGLGVVAQQLAAYRT